jgi:hypothetical protein
MVGGADRLGGGARMIDRRKLTDDLRRLVRRLEGDVKEHAQAVPEIDRRLRGEHRRARDAGRTGQAFEGWRDEQVTLSAVAWVLACVFVRFCEDNGLIAEPRLAGPGDRLEAALDTTRRHFQLHPGNSDREYLLWVFAAAGRLPGMGDLLDEHHSSMRELPLSVDGASELLGFWRSTDPQTGALTHDFTDPERGTRFLGDLYQDLSEAARNRYALLQTPVFVEEFILDRTLDPAVEEFGLGETTLIDPACGSGHFLLGAFERLLARWREREPETGVRQLCQEVLDRIAGVDVNPFATAIARFRLLVAALNVCEIAELRGAPDFKVHVATGDSLLHGHAPGQLPGADGEWARPEHQHFYEVEDGAALRRILDRRYAAVVANPPYITPKDPALRDAYRARYQTCYRAYALSVPFMERLFDLSEQANGARPAGFVGQITANSFMKREFGKRLIEDYLAKRDLTQIIDTSGAYIPGHGTPTVILVGRSRPPVHGAVRGVLGIRGEPSTPSDPSRAHVWSEIVALLGRPGTEGEYVGVEDIDRRRLLTHPWSLQGGGASDVLEVVQASSPHRLVRRVDEIGFGAVTREDEAFRIGRRAAIRAGVPEDQRRPLVAGDEVRDWQTPRALAALWPYDPVNLAGVRVPAIERFLWPWRKQLATRVAYGKTQLERGLLWSEFSMFFRTRYRIPLSITFAFVATHNHFVLDRGGKVFNRTAPVIKLADGASEADHLALIGPLNSSAGCFWMKQVFMDRGGGGIGGGLAGEAWGFFYEHDGTKLKQFPLPSERPLELAQALDEASQALSDVLPDAILEATPPTAARPHAARDDWQRLRRRMIALQDELDWRCYHLYGLLDEDLTMPIDQVPEINLGERAFEIVLARRMAAGETETRWFERHGSTPITELPEHWTADYRQLVERRIEAIDANKAIRLIERPEYKRRWQIEGWEVMEHAALRSWLLDRLESQVAWPEVRLVSAAALADRMLGDADFDAACTLFAGEDADPARIVSDLLADESVPYLAGLRYAASGLEKRAVWERTWDLQRAEDAIDALTALPDDDPDHLSPERAERRKRDEVGPIDVPPKYGQADFASGTYWRHRGKLDVPKERFTSYPDAAADGSPLYGWAGWDHAQRAQALAGRIVEAQETDGFAAARLAPMLAGLLELLPWLRQWHGEIDPAYGMPLSAFYETLLDERTRAIGLTEDELRAWRPPAPTRGRRRKVAA